MNINKKYAVFGVAAVIAVAGVIYFGTSANQQASVANVADKLSGTSVPVNDPTKPPVPNPLITEFQWRKLCRDRQPHIQVLSPNGGEVYQAGQQVTVKWRSCNILGNVSEINLTSTRDNGWGPGSGPNAGKYTFVTNTANDGQEDVILPTSTNFMSVGASFGQYFKVEVIATGTNDSSNNLFTINQVNDLKVDVSTSANNPVAGDVIVNQSTNTNNVRLLGFSVKAIGGDVIVSKIPVQLSTTGHQPVNIISALRLVDADGNTLQTADTAGYYIDSGVISNVSGCAALNCGYIFTNFGNIRVRSGTTKEFSIIADLRAMNASGGGYAVGDTVKAFISNNDVVLQGNFGVFDNNGNPIIGSSAYRTGSSIGNIQTFQLNGISTTLNSAPNPVSTINTSGAVTSVMYRIRLNITATGNDFYIPRGAAFIRGNNTTTVPSLNSPQSGISFGILDGSNTYVDGATAGNISTPASEISSSVSLVSGGIIDPSGRIKISEGTTAVLDLAVNISEGITPQDVVGQYKVGVLSVNGSTNSTGAISNFNTVPVGLFQTPFNNPAFQ